MTRDTGHVARVSPDAGHAAQAVTQAQLAPVLAAVVGETLGHALQPLGPGCLLVPEMDQVKVTSDDRCLYYCIIPGDRIYYGHCQWTIFLFCFVRIGGCNLAFDALVKLIYLW